MTTLAASPVDANQLDLLDIVAEAGSLTRADFEQACRAVADADGWVNPNLVSAWLHAKHGDIDPRWYSAQWAGACGRNGFLDTFRDIQVPIDGSRSRGNGGKTLPMRRLR